MNYVTLISMRVLPTPTSLSLYIVKTEHMHVLFFKRKVIPCFMMIVINNNLFVKSNNQFNFGDKLYCDMNPLTAL